jgi:hypothetical protein
VNRIGVVLAGAVLFVAACSSDGATSTSATTVPPVTAAPETVAPPSTVAAEDDGVPDSTAGIELDIVENIYTDVPAEVFYAVPVLAEPAAGVNDQLRDMLEEREEQFIVDVIDFLPKENTTTDEPVSYLDIFTEVLVVNEDLLSARFFENSYFQGAANPAQGVQTVNLDPTTGRDYELTDMFEGGEFAFALDELARQDIIERLYQGDATELEAWAPPEQILELEHVALGPVAIEITFDELEVGPAVLGTPTAFIPYEAIGVYIDLEGAIGSLLEADGTPQACTAVNAFHEATDEVFAGDPGSGEIDALERVAVRGAELAAAAPETAAAVDVLVTWTADYVEGALEPAGGIEEVEAANDILSFLAERGAC